ncbi:hypothetical protein ACY2EZ_002778 [Listeria innocua]|uniref:hypothetical protein n=1 Tax=Listeria innocua TaxID=1642 RepID=UPI0011C806AA|nr:hypothetical protein [Listeria innocua]MBM5615080.1 hypothetical protein [Listeria innocua]MBM5683964.1 hypothetical protein [Listeria innocua]TXJ80151.1 hypothetical protein FP564_12830 [Listeria innocua]HBN5116525.1 hypothetical protein [Listeria innocua]HBN5117067.1 hypothetical protein [Listeria innocua]
MLSSNVRQALIYHKNSNLVDPWWGIYHNQLRELEENGVDYYVRFNYPGGTITLTGDQIKAIVTKKNIAMDGAYKIVLRDII